jgi:hypothetical protein
MLSKNYYLILEHCQHFDHFRLHPLHSDLQNWEAFLDSFWNLFPTHLVVKVKISFIKLGQKTDHFSSGKYFANFLFSCGLKTYVNH